MKKVLLLVLLLMASVGFADAFKKGQKLYVSTKVSPITQSESNFSEKVCNVFYGNKVVVIESNDKKSKIKVESSEKEGWISNGSLTKKKIIASGNGMGTTQIDEIAIAGKGFSEEAENAYKASKKLNYADVNKIEAIVIDSNFLKDFIRIGELNCENLGDAK